MGVMKVVLVGCAVAVLVGLVATALLCLLSWRGRRHWLAAVTVGGLTLVLAVGLETVPRALGSRELSNACLAGKVDASLASDPVTWQVLTGGLRFHVDVDADQVEKMVAERLGGTQLRDITVNLGDDDVRLEATASTMVGELPIAVELSPRVTSGKVSFAPVSAEVGGRSLPAAVIDQLLGSGSGGLGGSRGADQGGCDDSLGGDGLTVLAADVDSTGLSLTVRL